MDRYKALDKINKLLLFENYILYLHIYFSFWYLRPEIMKYFILTYFLILQINVLNDYIPIWHFEGKILINMEKIFWLIQYTWIG